MNYLKSVLILSAILSFTSTNWAQKMNNRSMERVFKATADKVEGELGAWEIYYKERVMLVLTDEANNRMRIFSPIVPENEINTHDLKVMLEANFHSALDAKYSLYNGFVISVFTHPLKELSDTQLIDALSQVAVLANNYGTTYSSTDLIFGAGEVEEEQEKRINESPSKKKQKGTR